MKTMIAIATAFALATPALADLTIAAGQDGGGYDRAAEDLALRLTQRLGGDVDVVNMNGSDEITLALCSEQADLGFAQIDAVFARALEGCRLTPMGTYGNEIAIIMFPPDSRNNELSDLGAGDTILADTVGSGSDLFMRTIIRIETGDDGNNSAWSEVEIVNDPISMAPTLAQFEGIDAVVMVRLPTSGDIENLINLGWEVGYLYDRDINDQMFNDTSLYEAERMRVFGQRGDVYWVPSFVLAGPSMEAGSEAFNATRAVLN